MNLTELLAQDPPHSIDTEQALLGSMILDPDQIDIVSDILRSESDFYTAKHSYIYANLLQLRNERGSFDALQLSEHMRSNDSLEVIGGIDYLVGIAESVPVAEHADGYARDVLEYAKRRDLLRTSCEAIEAAYNADDLTEAFESAEQKLFDAHMAGHRTEVVSVSGMLNDLHEHIEAVGERDISGVTTGYEHLDRITDGAEPGQFIIVAGRPSMGKTAFITCWAMNAAKAGIPVGFISLEMSQRSVATRIASMETAMISYEIKHNRMSAWERESFADARSRSAAWPLWFAAPDRATSTSVAALTRQMVMKHDLKIVFIDYLGLIRDPSTDSKYNEVTNISGDLKALARRLDVPIVAACQLNRASEDRDSKRPVPSDLRDSGAIEQDADKLLLIHRDDYYAMKENKPLDNKALISVAKNREGETWDTYLNWNAALTRFDEPETHGDCDE